MDLLDRLKNALTWLEWGVVWTLAGVLLAISAPFIFVGFSIKELFDPNF